MKRLFFTLNLVGMVFCLIGNAYAYKLPYPAGKTYKVIQGNFGKTSHNKEKYPKSVYAFDFSLKDGDTVVAAASGKVDRIKMNSTLGKCDPAYANYANYIVIDHGNGEASLYMHLKAYSSSLKVGDKVKAGQPIAKIGKSGYGCDGYGGYGYHLHFQVQKLCGSWWCQSVRVRFDDVSGGIPQQGKSYTSQNSQNTLSYIEISGSSSINENSCQYYTVNAYYTDGNPANITDKVYWGKYSWLTVSKYYGGYYAQVCASSVSSDSYTQLNASYSESDVYTSDQFDITIKDSNSITTEQMVEYVFDEIEDIYSDYFSPHQQTVSYGNDYYRYYPNGSGLSLYQGTVLYKLYGSVWYSTDSSIKQWYDSLR
jgi:murein DD-endopeptidase MepM/ murein hydrolase activator NlpD